MTGWVPRTFDDGYGRHALREPGGGDGQRDVLHLVAGVHPTRLRDDYIGRHVLCSCGCGQAVDMESDS